MTLVGVGMAGEETSVKTLLGENSRGWASAGSRWGSWKVTLDAAPRPEEGRELGAGEAGGEGLEPLEALAAACSSR